MPIQDSFYYEELDCNHDALSPTVCSCDDQCPCKSSAHCVPPQKQEAVHGLTSIDPNDFGGSDYDSGFESGWDRQMRERHEIDAFTAAWERDVAQFKAAEVTHQPVPPTNMLVDSHQPMPVVNNNPAIHGLIIQDFNDRGEFGKSKYGTYLQAHNGRDVLKDAYQEALDLCQYLRQLIFERDGH